MGQKEHSTSAINRETLRLIREGFAASGMTQLELWRACGIPRSTLANILSPTAAPRLIHVGQMIKIAVAVGADPKAWAAELEALERRLLAAGEDDVARRRTAGRTASGTAKSAAPAVQKRAARSRATKPKLGAD